jgi:hypothetical protein
VTNWKLNIPVVLFIFKRPDTTERVLSAISKAKPPRLFVVADGPRMKRDREADACAAARSVIERVDWDCEVLTNYSDENMGGPRRIPSGLDWVFGNVEEAIILEDDCLPHPTFFRFCEELLIRYRYDERISVISGNNFQFGRKRTIYSYYFSRYNHCWGWATWRRAWQNFDADLKLWPEIMDGRWLIDFLGDRRAARYWSRILNDIYEGRRNHWDYKWTFACWMQNALSILPNVNLVSNIGFGEGGSNTKIISQYAELGTEAMEFPLSHPDFIVRDAAADNMTEKGMFSKNPYLTTIEKFRYALYVFRGLASGHKSS